MVSAFCRAEYTVRIVGRQVGEIYFFAVMIVDELQGIFEHGHHAQAEQVYLDDAQVGAVFFIPLDYDAARHRGRF